MKLHITAAIAATSVAIALTGCANHDLIADITEVGQAVPTVYWEVGSTVCKAGESFTFQGKYTNVEGRTPLRSEVWYEVLRSDNAAVTAVLAGTSLSYTQTESSVDTVRSYQCYAVYPHQESYWDGHQNIFSGEVPVSRTLSPVSWVDPEDWDQERFDTYYPEGFTTEFLEKVYDYLTGESADSYYSALRTVYVNYPFTNEQFKAVGLPELDLSGDDNGTANKSDAWYSTSEASEDAIVGYYSISYADDGSTIYTEYPKDYTPTEGQSVYPVYDSSEWVFCRYDDNTGGIVATVRSEWLPKFRTLLENIPFQDWIYDSSNAVYKVEFSREYSLIAQFRSYDKDSDKLNDDSAPEYEGVTSSTDNKTITIN